MTARLQIIGGKHPPTDPNNYALAISGVAASANATVTTDGSSVVCTANGAFTGTDTFTYTVTNSVGGWTTGTVTVSVAANGQGFNQMSVDASGMKYAGISGFSYALDYAANLTPPVVWTPVVTNIASPENGVLSFTNTATGFYRTRWVP